MHTVRSEIWQSLYRYGSLQAGDFVSVQLIDTPAAKATDRVKHYAEYEAAMRGEIVKQGAKRGLEGWRVLLARDGSTGHFVSLAVTPDSAGVYQAFPNRQDVFLKANPGKDYHAYRESAAAEGTVVGRVIYRVDSAIWK